jgi:hypothetical protein
MAAITTNTRSDTVKTVSNQYFFNVGGSTTAGSVSEWDGATATVEWSRDGSAPWFPIKDASDVDVARTADSNGIVTTGKVGHLSVNITGGNESTQSLIVTLTPV